MRPRIAIVLLSAAFFIAAAITWWLGPGQHWLAIQTGTTYCGSKDTAERYCYWSGFGSVFPWSLLALGGVFTAVWAIVRKHNCHEPGCWRVGRVHVDDRGTISCFHHHPEGKPERGHIHRQHHAHLARQAAEHEHRERVRRWEAELHLGRAHRDSTGSAGAPSPDSQSAASA